METELTKPDSFIETELKRFETNLEITKEGLISLADSVKDLVIKDTEDKAGLKAVIEGRKQLKFQRVRIKKEAELIRESAVRFQKAVIKKQEELIDLIEPTETLLESREQEYYEERARLDALKEKQESDRIQAMIDKLNAVNYAVDFHELKALTDVQFENILAEATTKYNIALEEEKAEKQKQYELRLAEETRLAQAQKEQEEREEKFRQEQEKARIENERIRREQEAKQKEIDDQQRKIQEEQDRVNAEKQELLDKKKDTRIKQLLDLGMRFDGNSFLFETPTIYINFHHSDILFFDDAKWDTEYNKASVAITEYNAELKKTQEKEEEERKKRIETERKKREKEEKEERLLRSSDVEKFTVIFNQIDAIRQSNIWGTFQSKSGKEASVKIQDALNLAISYTSIAPSQNEG